MTDSTHPAGADDDQTLTAPAGPTMRDRFRGFLPVVVDIETGGFNCQTDAILEIAMTLLTMNEDGQLEIAETHSRNVDVTIGQNKGHDIFRPYTQGPEHIRRLRGFLLQAAPVQSFRFILRTRKQLIADRWAFGKFIGGFAQQPKERFGHISLFPRHFFFKRQ